ncbi:MAG: reactive intermediate/imine deaminase [Magnetococcales bacterium]|nr:reactive intermediate/imine deaminase [Magnetococcales bacterium]
MTITAIESSQAPQAIGPYSQGVRVGPWVYLSGQIALDPEHGSLCQGDVEEQMQRVMENVGALLAAAGANWQQVVKSTLYLVDMADFARVNAVYARYLSPPYPARSTVGVAALPKGARVEMDVVAWLPA